MTPNDLAQHLSIDPKRLRRWLRAEFPRSQVEKHQRWELAPPVIEAAKAHFVGHPPSGGQALGAPSATAARSELTAEQTGALWARMKACRRHAAAELTRDTVPTEQGVYAWFHSGQPVYSGMAGGDDGLRGRIWGNHLKTGDDLSTSSFRRNVCEYLGIAPTSRTRRRPSVMTTAEVEPVNRWIRSCEIAWLTCGSRSEAAQLERRLHSEWLPPLSKR